MIIVLFHVFYVLGKFVFHRYKNNIKGRAEEEFTHQSKNDLAIMDQNTHNESYMDGAVQSKAMMQRTNLKRRYSNDDSQEERKPSIRFSPPAYIQRYEAVQKVLSDKQYDGKLKKIVDFGCSELGFCLYLKRLIGVEEVLFVDIDRSVLELYKEKARPLHVDYLHRRLSPLVLHVLEGSVTDNDKVLENCDAVVCIEMIEHLYPEPLTMLPNSIFGFIRPKVAVITTPNADFNVLFENMSGFRHPDHKFEWTRKEFEDWAYNVVSRFPEYEVTFHGICNGPPGTEDLGACSQMAVFHKSYNLEIEIVPSIEGLYKPVAVYEYPYEIDNRSDEQKILDDAVYYINKFFMNDKELSDQISLQKLVNVMDKFYISVDDLKEILKNADWTVIDGEDGPVVLVPSLSSSFSDHSIRDEEFLDDEYPPGQYDWGEDPGPPADYVFNNYNGDIDIVSEEDWDNEPRFIVSNTENENRSLINDTQIQTQTEFENEQVNVSNTEFEKKSDLMISNVEFDNDNTININLDTEIENSTPSIHPEDVCLDDIETESRSTELANSLNDESIFISSFSETKDSENSETPRNYPSRAQASSINTENKMDEINVSNFSPLLKEAKAENLINESLDISCDKNTSICSIFLEPSKLSKDIFLKDVTDTILESTITSPMINEINKKIKLNNSISLTSINENSFEEPKYTSSPHVSSVLNYKKRKVAKKRTESSQSDSNSNSSNEDLNCSSHVSNNIIQKNKFDNPSTCSNESVIAVSNLSEYSPQTNGSESPEKIRHYTGTIPKNINGKVFDVKLSQKETKLEDISPETPESLITSWSPEIMDSGYPNSNSPPDLSPEHDLSSIMYNHTSDSGSPSIADAPKIDFLEIAEVENRDLANNNLDGEGNYMEAQEHQQINDLHPLINVLENDLENENDIYLARDGFPVWLLRLLQRFDADGVGINLPMLPAPNEDFDD